MAPGACSSHFHHVGATCSGQCALTGPRGRGSAKPPGVRAGLVLGLLGSRLSTWFWRGPCQGARAAGGVPLPTSLSFPRGAGGLVAGTLCPFVPSLAWFQSGQKGVIVPVSESSLMGWRAAEGAGQGGWEAGGFCWL